jgi:hypothetical protein
VAHETGMTNGADVHLSGTAQLRTSVCSFVFPASAAEMSSAACTLASRREMTWNDNESNALPLPVEGKCDSCVCLWLKSCVKIGDNANIQATDADNKITMQKCTPLN